MLPSLTAARRMRLRQQGHMLALVVSVPVGVLLATGVYKLGAGISARGADTVTAGLGYVFGAGVILSVLVGLRTARMLVAHHHLDKGQGAYWWAMWWSIAALGGVPVWLLLGPTLVTYFFGATAAMPGAPPN